MQTAIVKVGLLSFLEEIPAFTPPVSSLLPSVAGVEGADEGSLSFGGANIPVTGATTTTSESNSAGGANNGAAGEESASISAGGRAVFNNKTEYVQSGFAQGNESTSTPLTNPNILWGAVATAALGATLADWQRKREEEEARKRAEAPAQEKKGGSGKKTPGQRAYEKKMQHKRIVGESQALLNEKAMEKKEQSEKARQNLIAKNEDRAPVDMAKVNQLVEAQKKAELQAGLAAYYEGRKKGEENKVSGSKGLAVPVKVDGPPNWWEKITNAVGQAWDTTQKAVTSAWDATKTVVTSAWNMTKKVATDFGNLVVETGRSLSNSFNRTVVPNLKSVATDIQNDIKKAVGQAWAAWTTDVVPTAVLNRLPNLRPVESFQQDQWSVPGTGYVECVTTAAVTVRNIINEQLAALANKPALPDLLVTDYVLQTDALGSDAWEYRVPSNQPPVPIVNMPIAGWMHPGLQLPNTLENFATEFQTEYGCSFRVEQTSGNSLDDIADNLQQGNLVIVHGLFEVPIDLTNGQFYLGGAPHTMGPVISIDGSAGNITILDTAPGKLSPLKMPIEDFNGWWGRQSLGNAYTEPNTMTVVIPDTVCAPVNTPTPSPTSTPSPTPTSTTSTTTTPSNTPASSQTSTPAANQNP